MLSGDAAGRQLFVTGVFGDTLLLDGFGADGNVKADGVRSGDQVEVDNDAYHGYCYWHRHHVINGEKGIDQVTVEGNHMIPQRPSITAPSPLGENYPPPFKRN